MITFFSTWLNLHTVCILHCGSGTGSAYRGRSPCGVGGGGCGAQLRVADNRVRQGYQHCPCNTLAMSKTNIQKVRLSALLHINQTRCLGSSWTRELVKTRLQYHDSSTWTAEHITRPNHTCSLYASLRYLRSPEHSPNLFVIEDIKTPQQQTSPWTPRPPRR